MYIQTIKNGHNYHVTIISNTIYSKSSSETYCTSTWTGNGRRWSEMVAISHRKLKETARNSQSLIRSFDDERTDVVTSSFIVFVMGAIAIRKLKRIKIDKQHVNACKQSTSKTSKAKKFIYDIVQRFGESYFSLL